MSSSMLVPRYIKITSELLSASVPESDKSLNDLLATVFCSDTNSMD